MKRADNAIRKLSNRSKRASGTLGLMADRLKLIAGTGLAFGGIALFTKWTVSIEQFNAAMKFSLAIMGDLTQMMREDMTAAAIQVASVTNFSATEAAKAYFFLASAGLSAAQSIAALPAVAQFAQAGMFDMSIATSLLTDALSALGQKVKDPIKNLANLVRLSDLLVKANTLADASVEQFARSLAGKAGTKMKVFNIQLEEGLAVLAAFAEQGMKAELASRAFAIVIRDLTRTAVENKEAFEKAGIAVFDMFGALREPRKIIADVEKAFAMLSTRGRAALRIELGLPSRSAEFLDALTGMSSSMDEFVAEFRKAEGDTAKIAEAGRTEFQKGMAAAGGQMSQLGRVLQPVIDAFGQLLQKFGDFPAEERAKALSPEEQAVQSARDAMELARKQLRDFQSRVSDLPPMFLGSGGRLVLPSENDALDRFADAQNRLFELLKKAPVLTAEEIAEAEAAAARFAEQTERLEKAWKKTQASAQRFFDNTRTPIEQFTAKVEELQTALVGGAFDELGGDETFFRAMADARATLVEQTEKLDEATTKARRTAERFFKNTRNPGERYLATIKEIGEAAALGGFDELGGIITVQRALIDARKDFEDAMEPLKPLKAILPELPGDPRGGLRLLSELGGMEGAVAVSKAETIQDGQLKELRMIRRTLEQMQNTGRGLRR